MALEPQNRGSRLRIHCAIALTCVLINLLTAGYVLHDLGNPNHDVGDMYGLEVVVRSIPLLLAVGALLLGITLLIMGLRKDGRKLMIMGHLFVLLSTCGMGYMAKGVAESRREWKERSEYYLKSTEELLHLARVDEDQFAIDALRRPGDAQAITGLCAILADENLAGRLRVVAANNLGTLGGKEARTALMETLKSQPPDYLKTAVEHALDSIRYMESAQLSQ